MITATKGIVLKTIKYGETSLITTVYTEVYGLLSFIVNGVRSSKAKNKAAFFQPANFLDLQIYYKPNQNLLRIKEYQHSFIYKDLPFNIVKTAVAQFLIEVVERSIKEQEANEGLYTMLEIGFKQMDLSPKLSPDFHLFFLVDLMQHIGIQPNLNMGQQNNYFNLIDGQFHSEPSTESATFMGEDAINWYQLLSKSPNSKWSKETRKQLLLHLLSYYQIHVSGFKTIKSLKILEMVFA